MARVTSWSRFAQKISSVMRKDTVKIYRSIPEQDSIGEVSDNPVLIGEYKANVTTPPESIDDDIEGTIRPHYYTITLDPNVALPQNEKLFVEIVESRQGTIGALVEVKNLQGGLLGWTLSATDEPY